GKAAQPFAGITELSTRPEPKLPDDWTTEDSDVVIDDISDILTGNVEIILAETSDFKTFGELAGMMGYRPVKAGEFLQIMDWLHQGQSENEGYYFCYEGRRHGYAVVAEYYHP